MVPSGRCWAEACSAVALGLRWKKRWAEVRSCWPGNRAVHGAPRRKPPPRDGSERRLHDSFHQHQHQHDGAQGLRWGLGLRCGPRGPSLGGGPCCRRLSLRQRRACSPRSSMVLWGCRREGRSDGDGAVREVLGGGVLGRGSPSKLPGTLGGGQVVLAGPSCSPRGASADGPRARPIYPATDYGGSAPLDLGRRPHDAFHEHHHQHQHQHDGVARTWCRGVGPC